MSNGSTVRSKRRRARRRALLEEQGAIVEEADPPLAQTADMIRAMWWPVMGGLVDAVAPERRGEIDPGLRKIAELGKRFTAGDYIERL